MSSFLDSLMVYRIIGAYSEWRRGKRYLALMCLPEGVDIEDPRADLVLLTPFTRPRRSGDSRILEDPVTEHLVYWSGLWWIGKGIATTDVPLHNRESYFIYLDTRFWLANKPGAQLPPEIVAVVH